MDPTSTYLETGSKKYTAIKHSMKLRLFVKNMLARLGIVWIFDKLIARESWLIGYRASLELAQ